MQPISSASRFVLAALLAGTSAAQTHVWRQQYPPTLPEISDVEVLSALNVWTAGVDGRLRHTTDGGVHWSEVASGSAAIRALSFANGNLGFVCGDGLWRTTDAGQSWQIRVAGSFEDVVAPTAALAWALRSDGRAFGSSDGGFSWTDLGLIAGTSGTMGFTDLHFLPTGEGWACGPAAALFATSDGGTTWASVATGSSADFRSVHFVDAQTGWVCADASILHTTDGGASWMSQTVPANASLEDASFLTALRGWAVARDGSTFSTSDGGSTWTPGAGSSGTVLRAIEFADFFSGYAAGIDGRIYASGDGGNSWFQVAGGTAVPLPSVFGMDAVGANFAWAATGSDDILRTVDGGLSWTPVSAGVNFQWRDVSFIDVLHGYACGKRQAFFPSIAVTDDGGLSWTSISYGMMVDFHDVEALGPNTALVTGDTFVWKTTDGGISWPSVTPMPFGTFHGMDFVDSQRGWIAGSNVFRTDDGGSTWTLLADPTEMMYDVGFADASTGWCVGEAGTVMKTVDGGDSWSTTSIPGFTGALQGISVIDDRILWITGQGGFVARSMDGGASFVVEDPGLEPGAEPWSVCFVDAETGWIGGYYEMGVWARRSAPAACLEPRTYCTGKINSAGREPRLSWSGAPSASFGSFAVTVQSALPNKLGILVYSTNGAAGVPLHGGTLCVAQPFQRTPGFHLDSAGRASRPISISPSMVGTTRWYQVFYRDPAAADGSGWGLTSGLEATFCP